jgi:hypothetical protein
MEKKYSELETVLAMVICTLLGGILGFIICMIIENMHA